MKKIFAISVLLATGSSAHGMNILKEFFTRDIKTIKEQIRQIENDENCSDYERHRDLSALYQDLHDAYTKKENFDDQTAKDIDDKRIAHRNAALEIWKKNEEIEKIETEIQKKLSANISDKKAENYIALIPLYERLIGLNPHNDGYKTKLNKLEKLKLRTEVKVQIAELRKVNNKKGLIVALTALRDAYDTPANIASCNEEIEKLKQEVEQEEQKHDEELLRVILYNEVQANIALLELGDANIADQEQQLQLINLLEESIKRGQEIPAYAERVKADKNKVNLLRAQALDQINAAMAHKEQELNERSQKLEQEKLTVASNTSLPELRRKMQLACLFDSSAEIWLEYPERAKSDWKKARSLRYEALALAKSTKDTNTEKELLALLAPKVD